MNSKKHFHFSDLLHYDPAQKKGAALRKGLQEYQFLYSVTASAIQNLEEGNFEKFDALVGENACQIRAIKIALIASKNKDWKHLKEKIEKNIAIIHELLTSSSLVNLMQEWRSLKDVIDQFGLDLQLTKDELFITLSYFLYEMKTSQLSEFWTSIMLEEKCAPNNLQKKFPQITNAFVEKLAKKLRKRLAADSVAFVREVAEHLQDPSSLRMFSEFATEHNSLSCLPNFWSFKVLFSHAKKEKIPLVLHLKVLNETEAGYYVVDEDFIYLKSCPNTDRYLHASPLPEEMEKPACVIQGVICSKDGSIPCKKKWKKRMKDHCVMDILLAAGADHRQYPNPDLTVPEHDEEYVQYKTLAEKKGFSLNNPTTFFVNHIFCSQPNRIQFFEKSLARNSSSL
jgi:hypothetical protein